MPTKEMIKETVQTVQDHEAASSTSTSRQYVDVSNLPLVKVKSYLSEGATTEPKKATDRATLVEETSKATTEKATTTVEAMAGTARNEETATWKDGGPPAPEPTATREWKTGL
ncbi:hypothetical protein OESDEN_14004 [Oesophagostomum dentatum]|uniref:Uncharacterized protein n=1 Tax=Oesophagostomum dentatum TaxID=61180 RepID=A0A0B1SQT3_OESDE|nr:hypothetical protein OESDEN_14004 [Oesophagostomum dentatum]